MVSAKIKKLWRVKKSVGVEVAILRKICLKVVQDILGVFP